MGWLGLGIGFGLGFGLGLVRVRLDFFYGLHSNGLWFTLLVMVSTKDLYFLLWFWVNLLYLLT